MRCTHCNDRDAVFENLMIGPELGAWCRECATTQFVALAKQAGADPDDLKHLTEGLIAQGLAMGQRIAAAAQQPPTTADPREIIRRLTDDDPRSGPSAA